MKVPLSWLREFVDPGASAAELAERLTMAGVEIESVQERGRELDGIIVGEIVAAERHPNADRLTVCAVRVGDETRRVVCGAPNARPGIRVAYAQPGTVLPDGRRIEAAEVRGVLSAGMLCSAKELGLGDDAAGLMELGETAGVGRALAVDLGIADTVLDVSITPNRGDCLSVLGLAREIAALYDVRRRRRTIRVRESGAPAASLIAVRIDAPDGCARYSARYIAGVRVAPSPAWLRQRLLAADLRPINNIVDVTNYVMLERGQPLHAFDYDRLPHPQIVVRRAASDRVARTLDDKERDLDPDDLLITTGAEPVAIAGVMGGANSEVSAETRNILLESAWFEPSTIRRTARRLGLRSEASYRFERGVDIAGVVPALDRAAALIAELGGGTVAPGVVEAYPRPRHAPEIDLRVSRIEFLLGVPVTRREASNALRRLGATVATGGRKILRVTPPSFRHDLEREIDLIEEIIRLIGYERVPTTLPAVETRAGGRTPNQAWESELRHFLAAQGLHEMITWSFASTRSNQIFRGIGVANPQPVRVLNPIVMDEPEMRLSLCPGLVQAVRTNLNHGEDSVAGFSIGKVFWHRDGTPEEARRVAGVLCGKRPELGLAAGRAAIDFLDAKGIVEATLARLRVLNRVRWQRLGQPSDPFHPGKSAQATIDGRAVGVVGALHPNVEAEFGFEQPCWLFEFDLDQLLHYVPPRSIFQELSRFPAVVRDLAVVTDVDFASDEVSRFVSEWGKQVVERVVLFDQYTGAPIPAGKKNLAYSIAYRARERTLTDEEVNQLHRQLLEDLSAALPVELRR
ncbi:MAG TPA: phenylalanine--tRNA ligase subunit beta [Candidatus Binatia bacterium]|nr:phenylalanine--tRNA ligase subunit beta [Candidatus Binatia bacterium]